MNRATCHTPSNIYLFFTSSLYAFRFTSPSQRQAPVVHPLLVRPGSRPRHPGAAVRDGRLLGHLPVEDQRRLPAQEDGVQAGEPPPDLRPANPVVSQQPLEVPAPGRQVSGHVPQKQFRRFYTCQKISDKVWKYTFKGGVYYSCSSLFSR